MEPQIFFFQKLPLYKKTFNLYLFQGTQLLCKLSDKCSQSYWDLKDSKFYEVKKTN